MNPYELKYQDRASQPPAFLHYKPPSQAFPSPAQTPTTVLPSKDSEHDDASGDFQSMVVMDDFDVEKELHKAQEDGTNAFKVLSMCFYEKTRAKLSAKRHGKPPQESHENHLPLQELPLKSNASPNDYSKIVHRTHSKGQSRGLSDLQNSHVVASDKSASSAKENQQNFQSTKSQGSIPKSSKGNAINNCWGPATEQPKSPKRQVDVKEVFLIKEDILQNKQKNPSKSENENTTTTSINAKPYYFSILKQKYSSPQRRTGMDSYHIVDGPSKVSREKTREDIRPTTINSSRELRSSGIPVTKIVDLKERVRQSRDGKIMKEVQVPKSARNILKHCMPGNLTEAHIGRDLRNSMETSSLSKAYRGHLSTIKGKDTEISSRVRTLESDMGDMDTPFLDELKGDLYYQAQKVLYEKAKKVVEKQRQEDVKKKNSKDKIKEPFGAQMLKLHISSGKKLRSSSKTSQNADRENEGQKVQSSRREKDGKVRRSGLKVQDENSQRSFRTKGQSRLELRKDTYSLLEKSSEQKRMSLDTVDMHRSGSYSSKMRLKLNMDALGKDRYEIEPNTLSLREYSTKITKERVPSKTGKGKEKTSRG